MNQPIRVLPYLLVAVVLLVGCSQAPTVAPPTSTTLPPTEPLPPTATATTAPSATPIPTPEETVLELSGAGGAKSLTMAELQSLPAAEGQAGTKSSTGKITVPSLYKGVSLQELAELVGGMDETMGMNVVAKDGYAMTLSYKQITEGEFIAYDPATGDEKTIAEPLTVIIAYENNGEPLAEDSEGMLRMMIISPKNNQVTDGHWAVKWVTRIEVKPLGAEWSLEMNGAIQDVIDRNTFQSCGAPGCHQATWTDDKAQPWAGVPLWLLAGRVDDDVKHDGPAFDEALAAFGYQISLVATDGYTLTVDSQRALRNNNILVAYQVNDNPLPEKYFPLRLVGSEVEKNEMIGAITQINLIGEAIQPVAVAEAVATPTVEPAPTPEPAEAAPSEAAALSIVGEVQAELALTEEDLRQLELVQLTVEHPKKGPLEVEGVRLIALLMQAGVKPGAKTLVLTASDGYAIEIGLADVQACADCLVTFTDTPEQLNLSMPGMESSFWVKNISRIEVK